MKLFILCLSLLFFSTSMEAQTHNLSFYLKQAKANSPVINKSKNGNKIVTLDLKQIKKAGRNKHSPDQRTERSVEDYAPIG